MAFRRCGSLVPSPRDIRARGGSDGPEGRLSTHLSVQNRGRAGFAVKPGAPLGPFQISGIGKRKGGRIPKTRSWHTACGRL